MKRCQEYKHYLLQQGYNPKLIDKQFHRATSLSQDDLLKPKSQITKKVYPLVLDFNPILPIISKILKKHIKLLYTLPTLKEIFPEGSIIPAYRRTKNLKELVAPSKFMNKCPLPDLTSPGFFTCNNKCDLCQNYSSSSRIFYCAATGRSYYIKQYITCTTKNVIYLLTCSKCNVQYIGSTSTEFKVRFRNHKSHMLTNKKTCVVATHFNHTPHELTDLAFLPIERITDTIETNKKLLSREIYWTAQLRTIFPYGLNKRNELNSKKRINFAP
ncbi:hypothetical protein HOLleu_22175 [Holothuria leucospilota]|uniref:GIY-YIG domain-containing protein n=1 Tax=Holothuria leucospilota TaxID=206669 RepID=A0A9Q1BYP3_HOLLE|nr:hypothetical protein HOLleu_22175 [Holothuria leucospilota]